MNLPLAVFFLVLISTVAAARGARRKKLLIAHSFEEYLRLVREGKAPLSVPKGMDRETFIRDGELEVECYKEIHQTNHPWRCPYVIHMECIKDWDGKYKIWRDVSCRDVKVYQCIQQKKGLPFEVVDKKQCKNQH